GTHRRTVLRAIRGARGGREKPRRVRSRRTRESKGREGILLHVWPRRGIHPQGTCGDQFAVRLNYRGKTCDRRRHAHPATSESADAQGGLTQLRTGGAREGRDHEPRCLKNKQPDLEGKSSATDEWLI